MTVLNEYVAAITKNAARYKEAEAYYVGNVEETFASNKLKHVLRATGHKGTHNYCRVIVDAVVNRLEIANLTCSSKRAQELVDAIWKANELDLESIEFHRSALEFGDAYVFAWPNADGDWDISLNNARTAAIVYDPENPRKKAYAVKMWKVPGNSLTKTTDKTRMNVYTEEAIYKFVANGSEVSEGTNWESAGTEENPFGEIPVFHFRTHRPYGKPEHFEAYGAQNDMNKLAAMHMHTVDYQGAPQRYALAMKDEAETVDLDDDDDLARERLNALTSEAGGVWYMKGVHGMGEFKPADPKVFWEPIKNLKESMAALTDTPYHYLERGFAGLSGGEGLRVAEAPLLKKVADRQVSFATTWVELFTFILKVEGIKASVEVKWNLVESLDALGKWDVMLKKINAGLSHRQALREEGYLEDEIERIMAERAQEAAEGAYYQRKPEARVSTNDNENFDNRNGLTEGAKDNDGRGEAVKPAA